MTAVHLAATLPLAGTVRNLEDDGVELDVQGEIIEIDNLISKLREQFGSYIRNISQRSTTPSGTPGTGIRVIY
jgi:acylphosphatase